MSYEFNEKDGEKNGNREEEEYLDISDNEEEIGKMKTGDGEGMGKGKGDEKDLLGLGNKGNNNGNMFDMIFKEIKESLIQSENDMIIKELDDNGFCIVESDAIKNIEKDQDDDDDNWEIIGPTDPIDKK